jgi:hypothetical protein
VLKMVTVLTKPKRDRSFMSGTPRKLEFVKFCGKMIK